MVKKKADGAVKTLEANALLEEAAPQVGGDFGSIEMRITLKTFWLG